MSIEDGSIRLMASEGRRVSAWLNMPFNPRMVSNGRIEDPQGLSTVIKNGVARLGIKPGSVATAFPSPRITTRIVSLPARGMQPDTVLPREARRLMGSAVDYHDLFWAPLSSSGLEQRFYLLAAPKGELLTFMQTLSLSGFRPKRVDARALALTRGVGVASAFILNVETYGFDVLMVLDYVPLMASHRELQAGLGVEDLVEEIMDEFQNFSEQYIERNPSAPNTQTTPIYLTGGHPQVDRGFAQTMGK